MPPYQQCKSELGTGVHPHLIANRQLQLSLQGVGHVVAPGREQICPGYRPIAAADALMGGMASPGFLACCMRD